MSSAALVSLDEYLHRSGKPSCEYVDGVLHPKSMPTKLHALIQYMLVALLRKQDVEALPEVTVRLAEKRFLIPDVIAAATITHPYPSEPVLLCAEILSPEDRLSAVFAKCEDYHGWGVPFCWVIDPERQIAWEFHGGSAAPVRLERDGVLRAGQLSVRLDDLFQAPASYSPLA